MSLGCSLRQNASNLIHVSNSHQIFPHTWTFEARTHIWGLWSCGHKGFKLYLVLVHVGHYVYCALWILEQTLYSFFICTCIQYENILMLFVSKEHRCVQSVWERPVCALWKGREIFLVSCKCLLLFLQMEEVWFSKVQHGYVTYLMCFTNNLKIWLLLNTFLGFFVKVYLAHLSFTGTQICWIYHKNEVVWLYPWHMFIFVCFASLQFFTLFRSWINFYSVAIPITWDLTVFQISWPGKWPFLKCHNIH